MCCGGVGQAAGRQLDRVEVGAPAAVGDDGKGVELDTVDPAEVHVGGVALDHLRPGENHGDVLGRAHLDDGVGDATLGDRPVQRRVGAADTDHCGEHDASPEAGEESEEQRAAPPSAEVGSGPPRRPFWPLLAGAVLASAASHYSLRRTSAGFSRDARRPGQIESARRIARSAAGTTTRCSGLTSTRISTLAGRAIPVHTNLPRTTPAGTPTAAAISRHRRSLPTERRGERPGGAGRGPAARRGRHPAGAQQARASWPPRRCR